jgi:outer membrane protein TolC
VKKKLKQVIILIFVLLGVLCAIMPQDAGAETNQSGQPETMSLSLEQASRIGLENNLDIQMAKYDSYIKRTTLDETQSLFDTFLNAEAAYYNDQQKTASSLSGTKNVLNSYSVGLTKKIPTGTTLGLEFSDERNSSNSTFTSINPNHDAKVRFTINQPLGDNFFGMLDRGLIKINRLDVENTDYQVLNRIELSLAGLQKAYWKLALRFSQLEIARAMLERAEYYYEVFQKKHSLGMVEDAELFAQHANLLQRKIDVKLAYQHIRAAQNDLLFALNEDDFSINILPIDEMERMMEKITVQKSLRQAILNRRDYKQAGNNLKIKKINLSMKKNSVWPQIDINASFAHNGLDRDQSNAWEDITKEDNPEMYIGLNVSVPLENRKAQAQKKQAKQEKAQAIIGIKKLEHQIIIEVNNLVDAVNVACENIKLNQKIVALNEKKLKYEEKRFQSGRSTTDTLVRYQQDLLAAQNSLAQNLFDYRAALIDLNVAQNSLLSKYWQGSL